MDPLEKFFSLTDQLASRENVVPPIVAIMGSFNTGKSTLINNLLHEQISPEDNLPKTSCLLYFKYGERFAAKTEGKGKTLCFPTKRQLWSFLKYKEPNRLQRIEITLNHPLLKKCTLVDTPGIDGWEAEPKELQKPALEADKIIYLFHQRGIDELNKNFLTQIAKAKKLGHRDISFWINCNLGKSDGTSLHNTQQVLKAIFGRGPELYLLNSHDTESIETLRRYIEVVISKEVVRELSTKHRKVDERIPVRLQKSMLIQDDFLFLDSFWDIKNSAEKILLARNIVNNLPHVESRIKHLLENNQSIYLLPGAEIHKSRQGHNSSVNILEIKNKMVTLATKMMHDQRIKHIIPPREMGQWAGNLNREEFKVVAVGGFSSGKSTFFNAIMGENLLPAENRPTTTCITYIRHGPRKKAVITFKPRVNLKLCSYQESDAMINPEVLEALEEWLARDANLRRVTEVHMDTGKGMFQVTKADLLKEIKRTKKLFSSGLRSGNLDQREPGTLFRPLPAWKAKALGPVWETVITFASIPPVELDLETPGGRKEYTALTTSPDALRIRDIKIYHPGRFFELATFVDTPGLDSTYQHHTALTTDFLRQSDAYLFFLNGKHILNKSDSHTLLEMFKLRLKDYLHNQNRHKQAYEMAKFFFIINFADTLTAYEKEKAREYLRKNLSVALREKGFNVPGLQVFTISPLQALQGKDTEKFDNLLHEIELCIWNYRGRNYFKSHLGKLRSKIETSTAPNYTGKGSNKDVNRPPLTKFSPYNILKQGVTAIKEDTQSRFSALLNEVDKFKQAKQFKSFARGTPPAGGEVVTPIRDISYFRWINALNRKIRHRTAALQKTVYRSVDTWLYGHGMQINLYSLPPDVTGIVAGPAVEQMEQTISRSRNFYGGFKAKEARMRLSLILKEQEREISAQLDNWHFEMEKYIKDLITPGIVPYMDKIPRGPGKQQNERKRLSKDQLQVLNNYLAEIMKMEKILNSPGGT